MTNATKGHLEGMINGKRLKMFLCRKNTMKVNSCKECKRFYSCDKVLSEATMKREYRVKFRTEPPGYFDKR